MYSHGLRISRKLSLSEISWSRIADTLSRLFHHSEKGSQIAIQKFERELRKPLSLRWLFARDLDPDTNRIITALCEYYSADEILIDSNKSLRIGALSFQYEQEIQFVPNLRRDSHELNNGRSLGTYAISYYGNRIVIDSLARLLAVQFALVCLGLLTYLTCGGLFLYTASIFVLFLYNPYASTIAATSHGPFGLGLLSFLVVLAALSGKAIRNLGKLILSRGFIKKRYVNDSQARTQSVVI